MLNPKIINNQPNTIYPFILKYEYTFISCKITNVVSHDKRTQPKINIIELKNIVQNW